MEMNKIVVPLLVTMALFSTVCMSPTFRSNSSIEITQDSNEMSANPEEETEGNATSSEYSSELIEEIKSRILKSLHKTEAPKTHVPRPTLQKLNFNNQLWRTEAPKENVADGRDETKVKTDFLSAEVENSTFLDDSGSPGIAFHFNVFPQEDFQGAELWLYKKQDITEFPLTHIISINDSEEKEKSTTSVYNQTSAKGWIRFDVSHLISEQNITSLTFQISTQNREICLDIDGDRKPFLLLHTMENLKSISKRSAPDCANDSSVCCRQNYFINFKDINFGEWIIQPEGYEANYCTGSCRNNIDLSGSHHARVFMALCENKPQKVREMGKKECLTCAPTQYKPVSVIYLDEQGVQVVSHLPGMSVKECGCI